MRWPRRRESPNGAEDAKGTDNSRRPGAAGGAERRANVAVSASVPIRRLMGDLVARCGPEAGNGHPWVLARSDTTLPLERSLEDCEVKDGTVLYLRPLADGSVSGAGRESLRPDGVPGDSGQDAWSESREPRGPQWGPAEEDEAASPHEWWRPG